MNVLKLPASAGLSWFDRLNNGSVRSCWQSPSATGYAVP